MLHIIFWEPEIPGNTGAAIRLSACTGSMLHLVKPLGFDMDDAKLRRAGLDYHDLAHVMVHDSLDEALAEVPGRVWALTGHATTMYSDVSYADGDGLLFGRESVGLSEKRCIIRAWRTACAFRWLTGCVRLTWPTPHRSCCTRPGDSWVSRMASNPTTER